MSDQTRRSPKFGHIALWGRADAAGRNGGRAMAAQMSIQMTPRTPVARNALRQP